MVRWLAGAVPVAGGLWTLAIVLTPLLVLDGAAPLAASSLYGVGSLVCHQRPERSFHVDVVPWLVCARCAGLYASATAGAALAWIGRPVLPRWIRTFLILAAIPTAVTLALEWSGAQRPGNVARAVAALPLGAAGGWVCVRALRAEAAPADALSFDEYGH